MPFTISHRQQLLKIYDDLEINILLGTIQVRDMLQRVEHCLALLGD